MKYPIIVENLDKFQDHLRNILVDNSQERIDAIVGTLISRVASFDSVEDLPKVNNLYNIDRAELTADASAGLAEYYPGIAVGFLLRYIVWFKGDRFSRGKDGYLTWDHWYEDDAEDGYDLVAVKLHFCSGAESENKREQVMKYENLEHFHAFLDANLKAPCDFIACLCDFNRQVSETGSYELRAHDTVSGTPATIPFERVDRYYLDGQEVQPGRDFDEVETTIIF